ncbi:MAG TPA: hypothetical protein VFZ78_00265 [Flavisolibacter sp.]
MNDHYITADLDLWEAWIEFDPLSPSAFGTLHVIGEVMVGRGDHPFIIKCPCNDTDDLVLIVGSMTSRTPCRTTEVMFSEPVAGPNPYRCVRIYHADQLISRIPCIEVLV